jgi:hypothetical protein
MLREGDALGVYRLEELVGSGVTGVMFRARDTRLGRTVALRIVDPELASDPIVRTRLNRESTMLAQLDHPNVVPLYEAAEIDKRLCLSSRWVDGRSLARVIRSNGPLEVRRAVRIIGQVAAALQAAHNIDVIHRDVKPSNVLVTRGDHAYLTDFCLARRSTDTAGLTAPNELLASVDYVAPEAISGGTLDHRVDIYGLGLVLYEALTGEVPFPRDVDAAKVYAHLSVAPPSIHARRPEVPIALDAVVQRALAKEPGDRQQSAAAFALEAFDAVKMTGPVFAAASARNGAVTPPARTPASASEAAPALRPPFGPQRDDLQARNVREQSRQARRAGTAIDAAVDDAPPGRSHAGAGRHIRRALAGALILAFLALPAVLVVTLRDKDAGTRTEAVGGTARGVAVAGGRVWVADASGEELQATAVQGPRQPSRLALDAGRVRGVASRGQRLLVATDKALIDIPRGDLSRATRVSIPDPVGPLAVGGGSLWAATTAGKPELLRVKDGRLARIPLKARPSALAVGADTLWIANGGAGTVFGVDTRTRIARTPKVRVGGSPVALTATADAVWVSLARDTVLRLDPRTGRPNLPPISVPGRPAAIAADSREVWVARRRAHAVTQLDARTGRPLDEVGSARSPVGIALSDDAVWIVGARGELTRIPR